MPTSSPVFPKWLQKPETPFFLIDEARFHTNVDRLYQRIAALGSRVRPHLKTLRSLEATRYLLKDASSPATVSTLAEAEALADVGYRDLLYAVGIAPHKLPRVAALIKRGVNLHILLDSREQAQAVIDYGRAHGVTFSVFIEIDCDGHRGGILPNSDDLPVIARMLQGQGTVLTGLLDHAGESYQCRTPEGRLRAAQEEVEAIRTAAERVRALGIPCPILSVGSTPTAFSSDDLSGIDEVRAGVFSTFDLFMKNVGVCTVDDIAVSVVTSVIGHNRNKNWLFIDAGWMALSRDRGTATQQKDYGYGLVCDLFGTPYGDLCVSSANQEHGIIVLPPTLAATDFPLGSRLRILPNHACATAAMHQYYQVMKADDQRQETWKRIPGW